MTVPINTHFQVHSAHWLAGRRGVVTAHRYQDDPDYRGQNHNKVEFEDSRPPRSLFLSDRDIEVITGNGKPR